MWKVSEYDVQTLTSFKLNFHVSRFKYNFFCWKYGMYTVQTLPHFH